MRFSLRRGGWWSDLPTRFAALALLLVAIVASAPADARAADDEDDKKPAAEQSEATVDEEKTEEKDEQKEDTEVVDREAGDKEAHRAETKEKEKADEKEEKESREGAEKPAEQADEKKPAADAKADKEKKDEPKPSVTHHTVEIDGKQIAYTATAGKMIMKTDEGDPKAHVFFIAYTRDAPAKGEDDRDDEDDEDAGDERGDGDKKDGDKKDDEHAIDASRPVTFCFNGGPGSSSVWLHLGMLGPMRVKLDSETRTLPPPHELLPNEYSLLDVTDLVFIDPVSTGFSRPVKGQDKRQFHGFDEDVRSVGQFIHDYTTRYGRWKSPKFVLGESYGGIRAAGLSGELQDRYSMYLNGIVMVSAVIDFQTLMTYGNNDIAYVLFLPSYAATAWYHDALGDDLQDQSLEEVVAAAEEFAAGQYLRALMAGDSLPKDRRRDVVERMAQLTGLSEDYVEASNLRVPMGRFGKELLRSRGKIVGRFDSRYSGLALDRVGDRADYDPSASAVSGSFTSALNEYLRETLKVEEERVYEILTSQVHPWDYSEFTNRFVDASSTLRAAMTENPHLKVFAACGYYDLATPAFAMKYTRNHLNLAPELRDHFRMDFYEGGHMMYTHEPSLAKLRKDLLKFYDDALEPLKASDEDE
jgi:carboxypeptidase C (cathepsin A)